MPTNNWTAKTNETAGSTRNIADSQSRPWRETPHPKSGGAFLRTNRFQSKALLGLALTAFVAMLWGLGGLRLLAVTIPPQYFVVQDMQGADDQPGQKDLTQMGRFDDN